MKEQILYYNLKLKYEIDSWDLNDSIKNNKKIIIIDARSKEAYEYSHIKNSINLPHKNMNNQSTHNLDKSFLYITYCDGIGCNASTKAALKMTELGFQVKELIGGIDWYIRDGYEIIINNTKKNNTCGC